MFNASNTPTDTVTFTCRYYGSTFRTTDPSVALDYLVTHNGATVGFRPSAEIDGMPAQQWFDAMMGE
jgi:hypothetical protein